MLKGCEIIEGLLAGLTAFMDRHGFQRVEQIVGRSLPYFDTQTGLVMRQAEAQTDASG